MNKVLETLMERLATWPKEAQAELLESVLAIERKHLGVYRLSEEERTAVRRGLEEMRQQKFATEDKVTAVFKRYRS